MNKDVVVIPVFNRPEYLFVILSLIRKIPEHADLYYFFAVDNGYNPNCIRVIEQLMEGVEYEIYKTPATKYRHGKQSYNVLNAYCKAAEIAKQYVFLIEDDIFCGLDFFKAHYQMQAKHPDAFCSIASRLNNHDYISKDMIQDMNPATCKATHDSNYQSWGVCFNKQVIIDLIKPHCINRYFADPQHYVRLAWPKHFLSAGFCEQDGLIRRIADTSGRPTVYPDYPRCYHAGVWSYHRFDFKQVHRMNIEQRIQWIIDNCFDSEKMAKFNQYNDVFVADLAVRCDIA